MKRFGILLLTMLVLTGLAGLASSETKPAPGFEKLKPLVGEWQGKGADGKIVHVSYNLAAGNTAVMETLKLADGQTMVTIYHPHNEKLLMTHYCILSNQPRMQAAGDDKSLDFSIIDVTNLSSPNAPHMHKLVLSFPDNDHLTHEWTLRASGQDKTEVFNFERSK